MTSISKGLLSFYQGRSPFVAGVAMFVVEDEFHAEHLGQYASLDEAIAEVRRLAQIPWDQAPNTAPCMSWRTCGREYVVIEFDDSQLPWNELRRIPVFEISAKGINWSANIDALCQPSE
jgi:hypothetical protein